MVDGHLWIEQRRFILRHLRDFGFGRTDMAVQIEFEAAQLVKYYERLIEEKASGKSTVVTDYKDNCDKKNNSGKIYQLENDEVERKEPEKKKNLTLEDFYVKVGDDLELRGPKEVPGVVVEMEDFFGVPVLNTLWCMMAGKRLVYVYIDYSCLHR